MENLEIKIFNSLGIDLRGKQRGQIKTKCPFCTDTRKNKSDLSLSVEIESGRYKCHHCEKSGNIHTFTVIKEYKKPEAPKILSYAEKTIKWFKNRGISKATLDNLKVIISENIFSHGKQECFCFQFFENGILVNCKYRNALKEFKLESGAEIIPYNIDSINGKEKYVIITEGEIDALSWIEKGYNSVISVPNGASNNTSYLDKYIDKILQKEAIVLSTDNDQKGIELRDALILRLGPEKCFILDYKGVKDANEYLVKFGELKSLFDSGRLPQIEGIKDVIDVENKLDSLYKEGYKLGVSLDIPELDNLIKWELGKLAIVTGIPSMGKSEIVDFICYRLNYLHNWKVGYFSTECEQEIHIVKLIDKLTGKSFFKGEISAEEYNTCKNYIYNNFYWIQPKDENYSIDEILKNAEILIRAKNIKILVIDPYNTVEHHYEGNTSETLYINKFLAKLTNFKRKHNILLFLVAHPRKMEFHNGNYKTPTLYDISGSANFFNKADYGIVQHIKDDKPTTYIQKVKNKWMGKNGFVDWYYNTRNGRYFPDNAYEDNESIFSEFNERKFSESIEF